MVRDNPHIFHMLQLAAHRLRSRADRRGMAVAGVTAAQAGAMFVIAENPGATQRLLADALRQQSAVTTMVSRLMSADLAERRPHPEDARAWALHLTPKGKKALRLIKVEIDLINDALTSALGPRGMEQLAKSLNEILSLDLADQL